MQADNFCWNFDNFCGKDCCFAGPFTVKEKVPIPKFENLMGFIFLQKIDYVLKIKNLTLGGLGGSCLNNMGILVRLEAMRSTVVLKARLNVLSGDSCFVRHLQGPKEKTLTVGSLFGHIKT